MYRKIIIILFVAQLYNTFGQINPVFKIISEKDSTKVDFAHIFLNNKLYTYSNENGEFTVKSNQIFDTLKITHLSFETKFISYDELQKDKKITLKEKVNILDEVSITVNRKKRKTQTVSPEKSIFNLLPKKRDIRLLYETGRRIDGEDTKAITNIAKAVYVPNKNQNKNTIITKIILNSIDSPIEGDSVYIPFKVNLMTYDTINYIPKDRIFKEDLAVGKKRGETVTIDLSKEGFIEFPKEGICIVVFVYHTEYYLLQGYNNPPAFDAVQIRKNSKFREYASYSYEGQWREQLYSVLREQCFNFGVEIEFLD